jgi:hypothetical protein
MLKARMQSLLDLPNSARLNAAVGKTSAAAAQRRELGRRIEARRTDGSEGTSHSPYDAANRPSPAADDASALPAASASSAALTAVLRPPRTMAALALTGAPERRLQVRFEIEYP